MGSGSGYRDGVKEYQTIDVLFGVKLITRKENVGKKKMLVPDNTPSHSYTANTIYARRGIKTQKIVQISFYQDHNKVLDIDWGHVHDGLDIHVQEYKEGKRTGKTRAPTQEELDLVNHIRREDGQI